jgi:ribonuclease BN (tRNA processing enzyme)
MPFTLRFVELPAGRSLDLGIARVESFPTHHQPESDPHGLRVEVAGRRIAYTGDTGWFARLPHELAGADLCICECNFLEPTFEYHLDYRTLLEHAKELRGGRLVLTHLGSGMSERRGTLELEMADDGLVVPL